MGHMGLLTSVFIFYIRKSVFVLYGTNLTHFRASPDTRVSTSQVWSRVVEFGIQIGSVAPNGDITGTFLRSVSVHFGSIGPNGTNLGLFKIKMYCN